ncbi:MAG TPA: winged helix-turn-helix domain-containing protein, partial [Candidatus Thermoplasmatota archaeon]|nr:winged helix-turn-helix domain-containing protein [Candidatus Thermoplasmatota archaeon]
LGLLAIPAVVVLAAPREAGEVEAGRMAVEGTLVTQGPTTIVGDNGFRAASPGIVYEAMAGDEAFRLETPDGHATYLNIPTSRVKGAGRDLTETAGQEERLAEANASGFHFTGDGPAKPTWTRILPTGALLSVDVSAARHLVVHPGPAVTPLALDEAYGRARRLDGHTTHPGDAAFIASTDLRSLDWQEPFVAIVMGGDVQLGPGGPAWRTGQWLNHSRTVLAPDGSGIEVYDNRIVVVSGRGGSVAWPDGADGWATMVSNLDGPLAGDVAWTGVEASVTADGRPLPAQPDLFHMRGDLVLAGRFEPEGRWDVSGEAHFLAVDAGPDWAAPSVAVGLGGLALLLLYLAKGRLLVLVLGTRVGRRLVKAEPFGTPARRRVLEAIHVQQPVRARDLREATGLSRTALAYHLDVLQGHHVIERRQGTGLRNATYMLNSGSLAFAVGHPTETPEGRQAAEAAQALATAQSHPLRRALYEAISTAGRPLSFVDLKARVVPGGSRPLSQSTASHHLGLLAAAGAIAERREGRQKTYVPRVRAEEARVEQYRRLLRHLDGLAVVRRLSDGPLRAEGFAAGPPATRKAVRRLCDLGLVEFDPAARTYELAPFILRLAPLL